MVSGDRLTVTASAGVGIVGGLRRGAFWYTDEVGPESFKSFLRLRRSVDVYARDRFQAVSLPLEIRLHVRPTHLLGGACSSLARSTPSIHMAACRSGALGRRSVNVPSPLGLLRSRFRPPMACVQDREQRQPVLPRRLDGVVAPNPWIQLRLVG